MHNSVSQTSNFCVPNMDGFCVMSVKVQPSNHPISQLKEMLKLQNPPGNLQPAKPSAKFLGNLQWAGLRMSSLTPPAPGRFPCSGFPAFICGKHHRHSQCPWKKPWIPTVCRLQPPGQKIPICREILLTTHLVFLSTFQGNKIPSSNHFSFHSSLWFRFS